mgnify:CR=1 FL=1
MARGWESKSVEDQISEHEAESKKPGRSGLTPQELAKRAEREGLLLARARTLSVLASARDDRYRAILERALAHLDSKLAEHGENT